LKKILIISPHFPPSNLASVHRARLFAMHLPNFGWDPIILTVHENFYEEELDRNLEKLLPANLRIEKVKAFKLTKPRLIGDLGMRGFLPLYRRAKQIIKQEKIDFLFIHIPSFYAALLGRLLHETTGVKYGIDYIDPWVHQFPGSEKILSRHWFSTKLAKMLEPFAVKKSSLITGVAEGYYKGVIGRNPSLTTRSLFGAMPYGGEKEDHDKLHLVETKPYLFNKKQGKIKLVYAGAMLPKAYGPLEAVLKAISKHRNLFVDIEIHFIGTGKTPNDPGGFNIKPLAEKYGLWNKTVFEHPKRIPYLDVLVHLQACDGVFILGSTEPHYTPSKTYQAVLSGKPLLAILNKHSTAIKVIEESKAGVVLSFDGENEVGMIENVFPQKFIQYLAFIKSFEPANVLMETFDEYSAKSVTRQLSLLLEQV
jgi:hypothetical protein